MDSGSTKKNAAVLVTGRMVEKILGLVALVVYARTFSTTELSLVPLTFILGGLALVIFGFGILPTIVMETPRLMASNRGRAISFVRHVMSLGVVGSVLAGLLLLAASGSLRRWLPQMPAQSALIYWLAAAVFFQSLYSLLSQFLSGLTMFRRLSVVNVFTAACRLVLVPVLHGWYGSDGIIAGLAITSVLGCAIAFPWIWSVCRKSEGGRYGYPDILRLSWPFYAEGFVMYLRSQGDQLIVITFLGAEALAFYYVARRLYEMLKVLSDSVDSAFIPALSRLSLKSREEFAVRWRGLMQNCMAISLPMSFLVAACVPLYISIIGSERYAPALFPALILCFAFVADIIKVAVIRSVFVLSPPIKRLQITALESVVMLILLVVAAPLFGSSGVALAYLLAGFVGGWYGYRILRREIDTGAPWRDALSVSVPALVSFGGMVIVLALARGFLGASPAVTALATLFGLIVFGVIYINMVREDILHQAADAVGIGRAAMAKHVIRALRFKMSS